MSQFPVSNDDFSPLIEVVEWMCLVVAVLAVVTRETTKIIKAKALRVDDAAILISLVGI